MHLSAYAHKHFGGRCCVPRSVAFWLEYRLLLFRGLLRGLLCGCLLGCFLSCHLPILPFRWFASRSATFVAVEEMYRFMRSQCQEKNDDGVEKVATISLAPFPPLSLFITERDANGEELPSILQLHHASYAQKFQRADFFGTVRAD